jgi:hypothetical chaperone protein
MYCGLDFGTSNSTLGATDAGGAPLLLPIEGDHLTIPSAVFFDFEQDRALFGREAVTAYIGGTDGRLLRALKSILGSDLMAESIRVKRRILPFAEILGMFVGELKRRGETGLGKPLDEVVVGRPVRFVDDDDAADARARHQLESTVRASGFRHVEFQYEPIAAALDYEQQVTREELGLVIDLGGGTSDFSVVRVAPERRTASDRQRDILATAGVHIGGTDFDRLLSMARTMPELGLGSPTLDGKRLLPVAPYYDLSTWHRINRLNSAQALRELHQTEREARYPRRVAAMRSIVINREGHRLAAAVEAAKVALTQDESALIDFHGDDISLVLPVTREQLAAAILRTVDRIMATIAATLGLAGLDAGRIETLILTGGSTQIPAIMGRLRATFPNARRVETDAFGSVGLGLALDAARKFG